MTELTSKIVQAAKQKIVPATIVDVLGSSCSVQISGTGQVLKNLTYHGVKPSIGDSVLVDYKTGIPTVTTVGAATQPAVQTTITQIVGGSGGGATPTPPAPSLTDHVLATTGGLANTHHVVAGLTRGQVLQATSSSDAAFEDLITISSIEPASPYAGMMWLDKG